MRHDGPRKIISDEIIHGELRRADDNASACAHRALRERNRGGGGQKGSIADAEASDGFD